MATPEPPAPALRGAMRPAGRSWLWPAGTGVAVAAAIVAVRLRDPHVSGSWGFCPWQWLLGWDCPGCGGLRAVNDLTHGDVVAAASSNLMVVAAGPIVVVTWLVWLHRTRLRQPMPTIPGWLWTVALVALGVFTVVRNTPAGVWLAS